MGNLKIGGRLWVGFGVTVLLTLILGLYSLQKQAQLQNLTQEIDNRDLSTLQTLQDLIQGEDQMRAARASVLLIGALRLSKLTTDSPQLRENDWLRQRDRNQKLLVDLETSATQRESIAISPARAAGWRRIGNAVREADEALRALSPTVEV